MNEPIKQILKNEFKIGKIEILIIWLTRSYIIFKLMSEIYTLFVSQKKTKT